MQSALGMVRGSLKEKASRSLVRRKVKHRSRLKEKNVPVGQAGFGATTCLQAPGAVVDPPS
jgi:hypothetical protein